MSGFIQEIEFPAKRKVSNTIHVCIKNTFLHYAILILGNLQCTYKLGMDVVHAVCGWWQQFVHAPCAPINVHVPHCILPWATMHYAWILISQSPTPVGMKVNITTCTLYVWKHHFLVDSLVWLRCPMEHIVEKIQWEERFMFVAISQGYTHRYLGSVRIQGLDWIRQESRGRDSCLEVGCLLTFIIRDWLMTCHYIVVVVVPSAP